MARQHPLGTIRNVATRIARTAAQTAGQVASKAVDEVSTRIAERRDAAADADSGPSTSRPSTPASSADEAPAPAQAQARPGVPSPTDVARVVARNAAGLRRVTPSMPRRKPPRTSAPGAKLPARSGEGIVGV